MKIEREKLLEVQDIPLSYKKLCERLGLEYLNHNSKASQLKNLSLLCELKTTEHPKRYIVGNIRDTFYTEYFSEIKPNSTFQIAFDTVLRNWFIENNRAPLYLSRIDLLKVFSIANYNLNVSGRSEISEIGEEFENFQRMSNISKGILGSWAMRRISDMIRRGLIRGESAFRLHRFYESNGKTYHTKTDVFIDSEFGERCRSILDRSLKEIGLNKNVSDVMTEPCDDDDCVNEPPAIKKHTPYMIESDYWRFRKISQKETEKEFGGMFDYINEIIVLHEPSEEWLSCDLGNVCNKRSAASTINKEACRKILTTKQLDKFTGEERKLFVDINIKPNPKVNLKEVIDRHNGLQTEV